MVKLFRLGDIFWEDTQLIYHALANLNIEALVLDSPKEEYVCLGFHQNPDDELDLEYCKQNDIGIFRREIGGGSVWLDNRQVFYNIILRKDNPIVPRLTQNYFSKFLQPVVSVCRNLGMEAEFMPICDILASGRKFSGNGGGEIGECKVIAGGLLLDFEFDKMVNIMNLNSSMKSHFRESMDNNLTTIRNEIGQIPPKDEIFDGLIREFEDILGPFEISSITPEIRAEMDRLRSHYFSDKWMLQRGVNNLGREIKVREGYYILGVDVNFKGDDHHLAIFSEDGQVSELKITGDEVPARIDDQIELENRLSNIIKMDYDQRKIINAINDMIYL